MPEIRPFHALHADLAQDPDVSPGRRRGWVRDPEPAIYQVRQTFEHDGVARTRRSIVAALRLGAFSGTALLPHELACFVSFEDPGLVTAPVHRLVRELHHDPRRLAVLLDEHFEVELLPEDLEKPAGLLWAERRLERASRAGHAMVLLTRADRR